MSEKDSKRIYRQPLNYENGVLLPKIKDISFWRDTNIKAYESGVITLALLLPGDLRKKALVFFDDDTVKEDLTDDGKKYFDKLLVYILQLLEDANICFPKISYDVGHD
jgi:hypothetical protein